MFRAKGIKQKTITVFLLIFILVVASSLTTSIYRGLRLTGQVLGNRSLKAASQAYKYIDSKLLERIANHLDSKSDDYLTMQSKMEFYRNVLDVKYLYTMTENKNGEFIYLVDGSDPKSAEFSHLGKVEANIDYYASYRAAMHGEVIKNDLSMDNVWGNLVSAYIPIENADGKVFAFVGVDLDANEMLGIVKNNILTTMLLVLAILTVGSIAIWVFAIRLTDPIVKLRDYSLKVLAGEDVEPFEKIIKDEVGQLAAVLNNRIGAIHNILDNTGEGLLTIGVALRINREYSNECKNIFRRQKLEGLEAMALMFPDNPEERNFNEVNLVKIFKEKDAMRRSAYISLLSEETVINGRNIKLKYKMISDITEGSELMMMILRDITGQRILENKIEMERSRLDSVVKIMVNFSEFTALVNGFHQFATVEIWDVLESQKPKEKLLFDMYGKIHTFKGDFSIFGTQRIVAKLHEFEHELSLLLEELAKLEKSQIIAYFKNHELETWLDQDMEALSQTIGEKSIYEIVGNGRVLLVEDYKLDRLENHIRSTMEGEQQDQMLAQISRLRFKPLNSMMRLYPDYVEQLANRLGKVVEPMELAGGEFTIDEKRYKSFIDSMIHLFRNSIDHGIEEVDERVILGKPEAGTISCSMNLKGSEMSIIVSDDGRGIDLDKVRSIAIHKKIRTLEQISAMTDEELVELIFVDEFTTREMANEFSGRGIGLPAFRRELERLGGAVVVKTQKGVGTKFTITIPDVEAEYSYEYGYEQKN